MTINLGTIGIDKVYLGSGEVNQMYLGATEIYSVGTSTLLTGIEGYWKFDGDFTDATGNGHTATDNGTTSVTGKINQGRDYDGINDNVVIPSMGADISEYTINFWATADSTTYVGNALMFDYRGSDIIISIMVDATTPNKITFYSREFGTTKNIATTTSDITAAPRMYTLTCKENDYLTAYIDGTEVGEVAIGQLDDAGQTAGKGFGSGRPGSSPFDFFGGMIDEGGFWLRKLTGSEVTELYNGGSGNQYPF